MLLGRSSLAHDHNEVPVLVIRSVCRRGGDHNNAGRLAVLINTDCQATGLLFELLEGNHGPLSFGNEDSVSAKPNACEMGRPSQRLQQVTHMQYAHDVSSVSW